MKVLVELIYVICCFVKIKSAVYLNVGGQISEEQCNRASIYRHTEQKHLYGYYLSLSLSLSYQVRLIDPIGIL